MIIKNHPEVRFVAPMAAAALVAVALVPVATEPAHADTGQLGAVEAVVVDGDSYTFTSGDAVLQIDVPDEDLIRVHLAPDGDLQPPRFRDHHLPRLQGQLHRPRRHPSALRQLPGRPDHLG